MKDEKESCLSPVHPSAFALHRFFIFSPFELTQTIATGHNLSQARVAELYLPVDFFEHEFTVLTCVCGRTRRVLFEEAFD
jgi:hypothetical protein